MVVAWGVPVLVLVQGVLVLVLVLVQGVLVPGACWCDAGRVWCRVCWGALTCS